MQTHKWSTIRRKRRPSPVRVTTALASRAETQDKRIKKLAARVAKLEQAVAQLTK